MFRDGVARLLVFRVGAERFGIPLAAVEEVLDAPAVQVLPDATRFVLGISIIRETVVTVYDPRPILDVSGSAAGALLVFSRGDRRVGLAVDDVIDAMTVDASEVRPAPGAGAADDVVIGVVRRDGDLTTLLDVDTLLACTALGTKGAATGQGNQI